MPENSPARPHAATPVHTACFVNHIRFIPAAQRTWIALEEKGIPYTLQEVALKDPATGQWRQFHEKPEWFLRRNPLGDALLLLFAERIVKLR